MEHFFNTIPGWFSFAELYAHTVRDAKDGAHFVEVGSWKGRSAAFLAVEIANSGKNIKLDCVDTWKGSPVPKCQSDPSVINGTLYDDFLRNTAVVADRIHAVRLPSTEAAKLYDDGSLDFVFIDAHHEYPDPKDDITAWWPKVRQGGILAGDDYGSQGVTRAVREAFSEFENYPGSGTGIQWVKEKC